jgi:bile acid:Na+ symporter, BASS family
MPPILLVIITFGLLFVVIASLGNGIASTIPSIVGSLREKTVLSVMILISNFFVLPALIIGLASIIAFPPQVKMALVALALCAGAPFIPWLVALAKGNIGYSAGAVMLLTLGTLIFMPLLLPFFLKLLGTGATPSAWLILWPMLLFIALPLGSGMIIRARWPQLAAELGPWLGPLSITFLMVHICLFLGYTWKDVVTIQAGAYVMAFVLPLAGMLIGYLLSPPYVLSAVPAANPHRGSKIVSAVCVAQQNTMAVICVAIFGLGKYTVAGDYILIASIVTIIIVMLTMAELGARLAKKQEAVPVAQPANAAAPEAS